MARRPIGAVVVALLIAGYITANHSDARPTPIQSIEQPSTSDLYFLYTDNLSATPYQWHNVVAETENNTDLAVSDDSAETSIDLSARRRYHRITKRHHRHHRHTVAVRGEESYGRPRQFCGWEAARYLGLINNGRQNLNLADNWRRFFPRTAPAPRMAAVRPDGHHVLVLIRQIAGSTWFVHDGNNGHHQTNEHARSISGWTVVNPFASRTASR